MKKNRTHIDLVIIGLLYPTQRVAEGKMFWPVRQSVSQSVRQSCFSCKRNSSETAQQNFLKLCSYEEHECVDAHIHRKFWFHFFFRSYALFELRNLAKMKDTTQHSLLAQLLWNRSTEFRETL